MISATVLRDDLTETATELDRVLTLVSAADTHARELHAGFVDLGVLDLPVMVEELRQRLDDAMTQMTSARKTLVECADEVQRVIIGTGETPEPTPHAAPDITDRPETKRPAVRTFDWFLVRMLMAVAGFVLSVAVLIVDQWLHLVTISNDLYQPAITVILLTSVSIGHLDRRRIPPPTEVAVIQFIGVALAGMYLIGAVTGWRDLTIGSVVAAITVLTVNAAVGIVVLPRHRAAAT